MNPRAEIVSKGKVPSLINVSVKAPNIKSLVISLSLFLSRRETFAPLKRYNRRSYKIRTSHIGASCVFTSNNRVRDTRLFRRKFHFRTLGSRIFSLPSFEMLYPERARNDERHATRRAIDGAKYRDTMMRIKLSTYVYAPSIDIENSRLMIAARNVGSLVLATCVRILAPCTPACVASVGRPLLSRHYTAASRGRYVRNCFLLLALRDRKR